jgi:hypothetical protein
MSPSTLRLPGRDTARLAAWIYRPLCSLLEFKIGKKKLGLAAECSTPLAIGSRNEREYTSGNDDDLRSVHQNQHVPKFGVSGCVSDPTNKHSKALRVANGSIYGKKQT